MRKVILYIAMSIDGYIADVNGDVSWLQGDGSDINNPGTYAEFYNTIDTVILGYSTYHQIITELSKDKWVYDDKLSYVITHRKINNTDKIIFTDNLIDTIKQLKMQSGQNIWVCGGANIINQLIKNNLIDQFQITIIPTILGNGIALFDKYLSPIQLRLISTKSYNGMVDLVYELRNDINGQ